MLQKLLIASVVTLLLASCSQDLVYEKTLDIPSDAWRYEDTLKFEFDIADTTKLYALSLDVAHAGDYGFQNLYVQFHTVFPSGKTETKLVSLELAAPTGVWNGSCSGNECRVRIPLQAKARFKETGRYTLAIEQYMRQNSLPGINSMSLMVRTLKE